ncbi:glycosyltransferase family 4 protein [Geminicoccus roseus]|uniref:glycosyltransferase family 4 protein n=1 Tax=Geminicoccus roseus TaxID=404900 RepID=UPI00041BFD1A|nr:glycosyltransferase family 4 protein [Geminicoccus roseus]
MRILQIVADGRPGGGTSVVLDLCRGLRERHGIESVLASAPNSYALAAAAEAGFPAGPLDLWHSRLDLGVPARMRRLIADVRPDLVHAHGGRAGLAMARAACSPPFLYTVHGYHFPGKGWPGRLGGALAERFIGSRAAAVIWPSAADRALAKRWRLDPGRAWDEVIRNGIDTAAVPPRGPVDPDLIAVLGRLSPEKNPGLAVEMLAMPEMAGRRLVLIGGGPLEGALRARIAKLGLAERVRITGVLPRDQALAEAARAAVLVLPSFWEAIPVAVAEAMAIGVPVVASAVRGVPELVEDEVSGLLCADPADRAGFARHVRRILEDPRLAQRLVAGGHEAVERVYRLDHTVDAHARHYRQICNHATRFGL